MTTFTNSKLTDEYVSNATLIRLILWADQHNSHYVVAALRELQERRKADSVPVEINDDMAYAFHHALSDSSLGADEVEEIKTGLRAAFANVAVQPALIVPHEWRLSNAQAFIERYSPPSVEEAALFAWNACRAAMLQGKGE
nr:dienelactone hydrolase family protein [Escherichia coli]